MAGITERLHRYLGDPVVLRVCIFIYGILTFGFGLAFIVYPPTSLDWVLIAVGLFSQQRAPSCSTRRWPVANNCWRR
jgi:hypothetical protein